LLFPTPCHALDVDLQYVSSFFANNATARASIDQAASDISAAITSSLAPIDQYQWSRQVGPTNGQSLSSDYTWNFSYSSPGLPRFISITPSLSANQVRIFVRGQDLGGVALGAGASAGIGFAANYAASFPATGIDNALLDTQLTGLVDQQAALASREFSRGAGPLISHLDGIAVLDFPSTPASPDADAPYSVAYGPAYGTLALNTSVPAGMTLDEFWHLDYNTPVASGKHDLYSVALHEILHALGVGSSDTWDSWVQGTSWNGPETIAQNGGVGSSLVQADGSHIFSGVMSQSIIDGKQQAAAMTPELGIGTRKHLTTLDLAFLRDLNYTTINTTVPEPSAFAVLAVFLSILFFSKSSQFSTCRLK